MELLIVFLFFPLLGYLIGSIPFGLLISKTFNLGDIRKVGSGNIGATNVLRTGNKLAAFLTLVLDGAKGASAFFIVYHLNLVFFTDFELLKLSPTSVKDVHEQLLLNEVFTNACIAGVWAIIGHCFPIWLKFKGGKGVATALGYFLTAFPWAGIIACFVWLFTAFIFKTSSLAALVALLVVPIVIIIQYHFFHVIFVIPVIFIVYERHKENIQRLLKGEEPKIGQKKKDDNAASA